jgi:hypothetical protein
VGEFRPALALALDEFLASGEWPERERFRRKLVRRDLDHLRLDQLIQDMPKSSWESRQFSPDRSITVVAVSRLVPVRDRHQSTQRPRIAGPPRRHGPPRPAGSTG